MDAAVGQAESSGAEKAPVATVVDDL